MMTTQQGQKTALQTIEAAKYICRRATKDLENTIQHVEFLIDRYPETIGGVVGGRDIIATNRLIAESMKSAMTAANAARTIGQAEAAFDAAKIAANDAAAELSALQGARTVSRRGNDRNE